MTVSRKARRSMLAAAAGVVVAVTLFLSWRGPVARFSLHSLVPELFSLSPNASNDAPTSFLVDDSSQLTSLGHAPGDTPSTVHVANTLSIANSRSNPLITFIVIWSPRAKADVYLANFFASIAANPSVELLLIKIDKYRLNNGECEREHAPGVPGVREICIPMDEYYELHLDYLCSVWNCTQEQRESVREAMVERFKKDKYNSSYRPFRAGIFKKWMHSDVKLWGWCDLDIMLGNMERTFPWDLSNDFDVFVAGAPTEMEKVHLFMPGHMTVFRHDPEVARAFFSLEELSSIDNYLDMPWILRPQWDGPEEAEYSHTLFMRTNLTFIRFDAMIISWHHLSTLDGVYGIENAHWMPHSLLPHDDGPQATEDALTHPVGRAVINTLLRSYSDVRKKPRSTFSTDGVEAPVQMRDDLEISEGFHVWYDRRYPVLYLSSLGPQWKEAGKPGRRYTIRRERAAPVVERFEPLEQVIVPASVPHDGWIYSPGNRPWIREALYAHYQGEKYERWYGLPERALERGDVLYIDRSHGVHVWDAQGAMYYERMVYTEKE